MSAKTASAHGLTLEIDSKDRFDVREFSLEEGLSQLFAVDIVAYSTNPAVDFETIVGKAATFTITGRDASGVTAPQAWKGVISEIHQITSESTGTSTYHLTVVPKLWLLTQRSNCRVFQQMTDLEVVQAILGEWSIEASVKTSRAHKPRKYRVQYQETDHAFIARLLEAAGVTLIFQRGPDGKIVLDDAADKGLRRSLPLDHVNQPMDGTICATRFHASRAMRSGKITFSDHDHRLANTPLLAHSTTSDLDVEQSLEKFAYTPGAFRFGNKGPNDTPFADDRGRTRTDNDEAQRLADQAKAALVARSKRFSFDTNALDITAGLILKIQSHPIAEREGELLVSRVTIAGTYDSEPRLAVDAANASSPWRPEAVTPTPNVFGVECATVVGPSGETIHTDEFGRVRVQFHWDRYGVMDEQSSLWLHVNQAWSGTSIGSINLPRIGQEVIVGFLGGNPEEPIVVGRIHTNLNRPPFALPQNKTQSGFHSASVPETGGYNELMFEDKAGGELIRVHGQKDMATRIENDQSSSIGNDRSDSITQNDSESVGGDQQHQVTGNVTSSIGQSQFGSVGQNLLSMVGADRLLQTIGGSTSQANSHVITSQTGTTISCGASMIYIGPDSIVIQSPKVLLNPGADVAANASLGGNVSTTET